MCGNRTSMEKVAEDGTLAEWHKYVYNESNQLVSEELYNGKKTTSFTYEYDVGRNRISEIDRIIIGKIKRGPIYEV